MSFPHGGSPLNPKVKVWNTWVLPALCSMYQSSLKVVCDALSWHSAKDDAKNLILISWSIINERLTDYEAQGVS